MWLLEEEAHTEGARNASNFPIKSVIYGSGAAVKEAAVLCVLVLFLSFTLGSRSRVYVMPVVPRHPSSSPHHRPRPQVVKPSLLTRSPPPVPSSVRLLVARAPRSAHFLENKTVRSLRVMTRGTLPPPLSPYLGRGTSQLG